MSHRISTVLALALPLLACGPSLEGVYSGKGTGFLEKIEFLDDQRVELTFMGMTREGTYEIEEDKVKINNAGEISVLRIDDSGCLVGGGILGTYCKEGDAVDVASGPSLAGSRYAWGMPGQEMVLEFLSDDRVRMSMEGETNEFDYELDGDTITIKGVEGREMVFERRGDSLEGGAQGVNLVLEKQG